MRLKSARIQNFRSIRDITVEFGDVTRIVGANGAGKSTILRALDVFYASGVPNLSRDDFFGKDDAAPVDIALTFSDISAAERASFGDRVADDGTMTVARVLMAGGGKGNGKYYGMAKRYLGFAQVRGTDGARERVAAYRQIRGNYEGLPDIRGAGEIEPAFVAWEAAHPGQCVDDRDEGAFFGFTNVGHGRLTERTRWVYVPAVRDVAADVAEKNSPVAQLLELVVKSAVEAKPEIRRFREETERQFRALMGPENLTELDGLSADLTKILRVYYGETAVKLDWREIGNLVIPFPAAAMNLDDEGTLTTVDRTGNGLQRALIMTLLQHLTVVSAVQPSPEAEGEGEEAREFVPLDPGLVLAIEEPELYQHPTKQRHFARVLERLAAESVAGVASTQIIFSTHSPLFMAMERFEEVRLLRRHRPAVDQPREAALFAGNLDNVVVKLEQAHQKRAGTFTAATLKPKLHVIDPAVAEGFFACVAVVVEGESDRAALLGIAAHRGLSFEAAEIAIIAANGKTNIDKPCEIFRSLGIPVYIVWDNDRGDNDRAPTFNRALQRLMGVQEAQVELAPDRVTPTYACFHDKLETTLKNEIGQAVWQAQLDALKEEFGVTDNADAQKVPEIMKRLLAATEAQNCRSDTLNRIVDAIFALKPVPAPVLPPAPVVPTE